ncbi:MAG: hypothetical protein ACREIS_12545 [Nitrospiraceae bacterium]
MTCAIVMVFVALFGTVALIRVTAGPERGVATVPVRTLRESEGRRN